MLSAGTNGQVLTLAAGVPTWATGAAPISITNDVSSSVQDNVLFARATSGNLGAVYTAASQVSFNPSNGLFAVPNINLTGGNLSTPNGVALNLSVTIVSSTSAAPAINITGATNANTGSSGAVNITGGTGSNAISPAGSVNINGGNSPTGGAYQVDGGTVNISGGVTTTNGRASGSVFVSGGPGTTANGITGGTLNLSGGNGAYNNGSGYYGYGGNVVINAGIGGSSSGYIKFTSAPAGPLTAIERFRITATGEWSVGTAGTNVGTSGQVLTSNGAGTAPSWQAVTTATTATNISGGTAGQILYQSAASTTAKLATGTSGQVLTSAGSAAPTWSNIVAPAGTLTGATLAAGVTASSLTSVGTLASLTVTGTTTSGTFVPTSATVPTNGMYLSAANTLNWATNSALRLTLSATGDLTATGNVTAYSDERLKTNWQDLPTDFVAKLASVKTGTYDRTDVEATQVGVSAQSLQTVLPTAVLTDADGMMSVAYGNAALAACVMLAREVERLVARIAVLESK